jgi:thiamine biosynthesis lipoprotein
MRIKPLFCFSFLLWLVACTPSGPSEYTFEGRAMGTTYTVKIVSESPLEPPETQLLADGIFAAIDDINTKMSTYQDDSELSQFNQLRTDEAFAVSPETLAVLVEARWIGQLSNGAYDITVGPVVNVWGFGPRARTKDISDEMITDLLVSVGWDRIEIDEAASTIRKLHPNVYVDLSSIAKGYAADRVAEALNDVGQTRYLVELGGEMRAAGFNSSQQPWRVSIESPVENERAIERVVPLDNLSMATSGDYRNYYDADGERISHTIDPRTGRPVRHRVAAVTVVDPSCMTADGWATALTALGEAEGFALAESEGLAVLFQLRHDDGSFEQRPTNAFVERFGNSDR